jgi:spermidine synthase
MYHASHNRPIFSEWNILRKNSVYDVLYTKEGIECTLSVLYNKTTGSRELNINGQSTAYTSYRDIQVHKMLVHPPMLLHPDPREVLIVGFGMGCTSYEATLYENARVTCVELVNDEIEAAPFFEDLNKNVLENPKFTFIHDDGRNYIQLKNRTYDVISFNAIHPRLSPALYTAEFYEMCRRRMDSDSLICAWLPTNWVTPYEFQSLIKTFVSVFPHSTLWYCNPDHVVLVGGLKNISVDFDTFVRRLAQPYILDYLKPSNLADPLTLAGSLVLGPKGLERYTAGSEVVTDDKSQVEFSRCIDYGMNDAVWTPILRVRESYFGELFEVITTENPQTKAALNDNLKSLPPFISGQIISDPKYNRHKEALEQYDLALALAPQNANILYWKQLSLFELAPGR